MAEKKKLHHFLSDMLKLSCVKGFKHFATHMRGREEMICSIINEPSMPIILSAANSPAASFAQQKREAFPMSQKQQRRLSGYGFINVGLPPASPSESEEEGDENYTMFLMAGYSRYNRPYVWIRTNHERLVRLSTEEEKDYPLMLQTTSQWQEKDVKVWDVLSELIQVCTIPCPPNPFTVDMDYFESLRFPERALASAAMTAFLQRLLANGPHPYDRRVQSDLAKVSRLHFHAMLQLLQEEVIQLPPTSPSPSEEDHAHIGHTQPSQGPPKPPVQMQQLPPSAQYSSPHASSSSSSLPASATVPAQVHSYSATSSSSSYSGQSYQAGQFTGAPPPPHPQPPAMPSYSAPQDGSGGQFYTRRSAGTYRY